MNIPNHFVASRFQYAQAILLGVTLSGCMSVSASIPELTVTRQNIVFEGLPEEATSAEATATLTEEQKQTLLANLPDGYELPTAGTPYHFPTQTFSYERVAMELPSGASSDFQIDEVTVRAHDGTTNLGFVAAIRLTVVRGSDPTGAVTTLLEYPVTGTTPEPIVTEITLPSLENWTTIDPWKSDDSVYFLDVWAYVDQLPKSSWSVDVELTLSGSVDFSTTR